MKRTALPRFYSRSADDRLDAAAGIAGLDAKGRRALRAGMDMGVADSLVENVIGVFTLPLGVATNFRINGKDVLVPMATE